MKTITHEFVMSQFDYNPETGDVFRGGCRNGYKEKRLIKKVFNKDGYRITYINGREIRVHRLIWFMVNKEWPAMGIDHINGIRDDNRICNLRVVSQMINCQNRRYAKGVHYSATTKKWVAQIVVNKKHILIGRYASEQEGRIAYLDAKSKLHPMVKMPTE